MNLPRLVPASNDPTPISLAGPCPTCGRSDALRTARTETGRHVRCRFTFDGLCDWEGLDRPFRRPAADSMPTPFVERLARIAERVVDETVADEDGQATARIDTQYVPALRSAIRRAARDRDLQVRTTHTGDGRVEVRLT
jgi:hypothetical protein